MSKLSSLELREFLDGLYEKLEREALLYNRQDEFTAFLEKYNLEINGETPNIINDNAKILILGVDSGSVSSSDIQGIFKAANLRDRCELLSYNEVQGLDLSSLEYSVKYSDIFIGPVPHKIKGMGDTENFVEKLMIGSEDIYPKVQKLMSGNKLKITKSNLNNAIAKSNLLRVS